MKTHDRRTLLRTAAALLMATALAGCSAPDVARYQNEKPAFDVQQYFEGRTEAWGMVQKRSGEVVKHFHVTVQGHRVDGKLVLEEDFLYSDGTTQQRTWTITPLGNGGWSGLAGDVVGEAQGRSAGNTLHWNYTLQVPVNGTTYDMQMDDWMFLVDGKTLLNRTSMRKFGVEVAQVTIFFRKP